MRKKPIIIWNRYRNRTSIEYKSYYKFITQNLGSLQPSDVTKNHIQDLLKDIAGEQFTKKKYLQYLKNFFNWCIENGYITTNPTKGVKIKIKRKDIVIYTPDEVEKVLRLCEEKYPCLMGYFSLCVFAGLRPSEAERVEWNDVNFEGKKSRKGGGKTGLRRFVLKDAETIWNWLNHIKTTRPNEPLKPATNHIGLQTQFRRDLGLPWTQDVLRHSFGTYYYNLTRDLNRVSHDVGTASSFVSDITFVRSKRNGRTNFGDYDPRFRADQHKRAEPPFIGGFPLVLATESFVRILSEKSEYKSERNHIKTLENKWYPHPELNGNQRFRKPLLYPFELWGHPPNNRFQPLK